MIENINSRINCLFGFDDNWGKLLPVLAPLWVFLSSHMNGIMATPYPWIFFAWLFDLVTGVWAALKGCSRKRGMATLHWQAFWDSTYKLAVWCAAIGGVQILGLRHPEYGWVGEKFLEAAIMLHEVSSGLKNLSRVARGDQRRILSAAGNATENVGKEVINRMTKRSRVEKTTDGHMESVRIVHAEETQATNAQSAKQSLLNKVIPKRKRTRTENKNESEDK